MPSKFFSSKTYYDESKKIWSGTKTKPRYDAYCSIGQAALESLMKDPEHIFQICYTSGRQYTNREVATLAIRVAQHFRKLQVEQCEVIGLCGLNTDYVAPLFIGAMLSGLTLSTLDPIFKKDDIKDIYSIIKPKIMFCDGGVYKTVKEAFEELNSSATIYTMKDHIQGVPEITEFLKETGTEATFKPERMKLGPSHIAIILCSSGTTGLPKGVCLSHYSLLNSQIMQLDRDDKLICFSTLYWSSGVKCLISGTMYGSTRIISDRAFCPEDFFDMIEKHKATVTFTPPSQIAMSVACPKIKDYDLSSMVAYLCGGSALPYSLVEKMKTYMANVVFTIVYGMTEVCGPCTLGPVLPNGSTGQLLPNVEFKVINESGELLGPEESGELCIRTSYPWVGYCGNAEATQAIYEKDGWIHSGDVGYIDKDGNVFVVDRIKDILKYNNFHFSPTEIENVILEMPNVAEVCVCGIPDIVSTFLPAAAVVKRAGSELTEREVYDYVAKKMAYFKHLRGGVYFLDELPKTASGKNLRRKVADICEHLKKLNDQIRCDGSVVERQSSSST